MSTILTLCKLNISLLLKDKLSFFWSLAVPSVMLFFNTNRITSEYDLIYWWVYIVFNAFVYGVGLNALIEKDSGALSIIFSIKWVPVKFFMSLLLTQVLYSLVCMGIFNLIPTFLFNFNYLRLTGLSLLAMLVILPVAFIGYNFTYLRNLYSSTIASICNMLIFVCFLALGFDTPINRFNPFIIFGRTMYDLIVGRFQISYLLISCLLILISIPSIVNFRPLSKESR